MESLFRCPRISTSRKGLNTVNLVPTKETKTNVQAQRQDYPNNPIFEQVLNAFTQVVRRNLPLELKNTRISRDDIIYALAYANVHRLSIQSACQELKDAPSGNRLREVLAEALPDRAGMQRALNKMFRQQLHWRPSLWKGRRDYNIAMDLTLIPYHGLPYEDKKEIVRGAPKSGTTYFHGYATVSIVHDNQRYVVALHFVEYGEEMADIVRWLLRRLKSLKLLVRRVFLDKGLLLPAGF